MDTNILSKLCCPETHQPLFWAEKDLMVRVNLGLHEKRLRTKAGRMALGQLEAALVTPQKDRVYPVRNGLPILLVDEAILLS